MCQDVWDQEDIWDRHFEQRVPIGYIDDENHYILLSDGVDSSGLRHCIWIPTTNDIPYIIDRIYREDRRWYYRREYECADLRCISNRYLTIVNPEYTP